MERVCEELDQAKVEIEQLKEDLNSQAALSGKFKRAHGEKLIQVQEAAKTIEKQAQELNDKAHEISAVNHRFEDLQCRLNEKESIIRRLSAANDKLRVDYSEKDRKWEEEKRELVLALDEANEKNLDQEQKIHVFMAEIEGLKGLLSTSQMKCLEAEKKAKAPKELKERDDLLIKLQEENRKVEDQLKWKKEQFDHLEEAHEKLRRQFRESKKEWEREKSILIDEICSLQASLDSQTRISEDLQSRLQMCNQALALEESRRKCLEIEVSECRMRWENIFTECQDAKSQLEHLTTQRDNEIAALRYSLGTKEIFYKEIEHQAGKLEEENQELLACLKELREAQIQETECSSLAKLRNRLKRVEQLHRDCCSNLRDKEAEWNSQLEKLSGELTGYKSAVQIKETILQELEMELENCYFVIAQLKLQHEEASIMLLVLQSGIAEARLNLQETESQMSLREKEKADEVSFLRGQLDMKNSALEKALREIGEERLKIASLVKRQELLDTAEEQRLLLDKELDRCKEVISDSSRRQLHLTERALQMESDLEERIRLLCNALDGSSAELLVEREKTVSMSRRMDSINHIEEKWRLMQEEHETFSQVLEELSRCQLHLEQQALQIESDSNDKYREVCDALDMLNSERTEQCEVVETLSKRVDFLNLVEREHLELQGEIERYKEMIEASSKKALQVETDLKEMLSEVSNALDSATSELAEERKGNSSLLKRVEAFEHIEEKQVLLQREIESYKERLEESLRCQHRLEKQNLQKENDSKEKLGEVSDALDRLHSKFAVKASEGHAVEFELWVWKSISQRLKDDLEESQALRKELEASLLEQVKAEEIVKQEKVCLVHMLEEKATTTDDLQRHIQCEKEDKIKEIEITAAKSATTETEMCLESETESFRIICENDKSLDNFQKEIGFLEQESLRREVESLLFAQMMTEKKFEREKEDLIHLVKEKDKRIDDALHLAQCLEEKFNSSLAAFSLEVDKKIVEISMVHEAWDKIAAAEIMAQLEIEENQLMIVELEDSIQAMQKELESQETLPSHSHQKAMEIEAELLIKQQEMEKLTSGMQKKLRTTEALVDDLKDERINLVQDITMLSSERKDLLGLIEWLGDKINDLCGEDLHLIGSLEWMVQLMDKNGYDLDLNVDRQVIESVKENRNALMPPMTKKLEAVFEERSPFRELN